MTTSRRYGWLSVFVDDNFTSLWMTFRLCGWQLHVVMDDFHHRCVWQLHVVMDNFHHRCVWQLHVVMDDFPSLCMTTSRRYGWLSVFVDDNFTSLWMTFRLCGWQLHVVMDDFHHRCGWQLHVVMDDFPSLWMTTSRRYGWLSSPLCMTTSRRYGWLSSPLWMTTSRRYG